MCPKYASSHLTGNFGNASIYVYLCGSDSVKEKSRFVSTNCDKFQNIDCIFIMISSRDFPLTLFVTGVICIWLMALFWKCGRDFPQSTTHSYALHVCSFSGTQLLFQKHFKCIKYIDVAKKREMIFYICFKNRTYNSVIHIDQNLSSLIRYYRDNLNLMWNKTSWDRVFLW